MSVLAHSGQISWVAMDELACLDLSRDFITGFKRVSGLQSKRYLATKHKMGTQGSVPLSSILVYRDADPATSGISTPVALATSISSTQTSPVGGLVEEVAAAEAKGRGVPGSICRWLGPEHGFRTPGAGCGAECAERTEISRRFW